MKKEGKVKHSESGKTMQEKIYSRKKRKKRRRES